MADKTAVKEITEKLENGVKELFESEKYTNYLRTMSRFHSYSTRNILLIHMQCPHATRVAGYNSWKNTFKRQVKKGEHGIKIFAPIPFITKQEIEKIDPVTKRPVIGDDGQPVHDEVEVRSARFKVVSVFDAAQTDGEPLPELAETLTGNVQNYELFIEALRAVSPLPIVFEPMDNKDGYCELGVKIGINEELSEVQAVSAIIHEITHEKLHNIQNIVQVEGEVPKRKDRRTEEIEAESISFSVASAFGIDTGANAFGYIAEWSKSKELKELNASLDTIRKASTDLIAGIGEKYRELAKERGIDLTAEVSNTVKIEGTPEVALTADAPAITAESENLTAPPELRAGGVKDALASKLYEQFAVMFPDFIAKKYSYLRLESESEGFEPLSLEWVFGDRISVMHTYTQNGDLMYDPMVDFSVNQGARTMTAVSFEQSMPPQYQFIDEKGKWRSVDGNGKEFVVKDLQKEINIFAEGWFANVDEQGFMPVYATMEIAGEDVRITFDEEGNPVLPELPKRPDPQPTTLDLALPDPLWTVAEMNEYGYAADDMYPLSVGRAVELFDTGHPVYLLYPNNTEVIAFDRDEIITFSSDGFCGITKADWENSPVFAAQKKIVASAESAREAELLHSNDGKFGIYQVREDIENKRDFCFASMAELEMLGLSVERANYELVYVGDLLIRDTQTNLHKIFNDFNTGETPDFFGHSVSVSDVIVLQWRGDVSAHFVDSLGFKELPVFTGNERSAEPQAAQPESTLSRVGERPQPTVAELKAEVESGKSISIMDLSKAVNAERRPPVSKQKPSLLAELEEAKKLVARGGQPDTRKNNEREV